MPARSPQAWLTRASQALNNSTPLLISNGLSAVVYLFVVKPLYRDYGFPYPILLTALQMGLLSVVLWTGVRLGAVERSDPNEGFMRAILFGGAWALENLSLLLNSTSSYLLLQVFARVLASLMHAPVQSSSHHVHRAARMALLVPLASMCIAIVTDAECTVLGTAVGLYGAFLRLLEDTGRAAALREHGLHASGAGDLLYAAPLSAIVLALFAYFVDGLYDNGYIPCADTTTRLLMAVFLVVPLTFTNICLPLRVPRTRRALLGHVKIMVGLATGAVLFDNAGSWLHYLAEIVVIMCFFFLPLGL